MTLSWKIVLPSLAAAAMAQSIAPSNLTTDLANITNSPRYWMSATGSKSFPSFKLAPLGAYAQIGRDLFYSSTPVNSTIVNIDSTNLDSAPGNFDFISCDPEDYVGSNLGVDDVLHMLLNNLRELTVLIFYSTRSNHCNATGLDSRYSTVFTILTTLDNTVAGEVASKNFNENSDARAGLAADPSSYNGSGGGFGSPPTTAIAMIILYAITGIITSLFVVIIVTGAIRAHRHPERYGPRNIAGRGRQSRAKGIARAMLETLPIVKFGDHQDLPKPGQQDDVEMSGRKPQAGGEVSNDGDKSAAATVTTTSVTGANAEQTAPSAGAGVTASSGSNADGSDESGSLGCSICTEDFRKGEEVRVLPCNHKFHPECVDPWLLNVSGTCPLCRVDLRPQGERPGSSDEVHPSMEGTDMPPPVGYLGADRRSQAIHHLMLMAYGSREERMTALRRLRNERRSRAETEGQATVSEGDSRGLSTRLRERFRIRTRRHDAPGATLQTTDGSSAGESSTPEPTRQ